MLHGESANARGERAAAGRHPTVSALCSLKTLRILLSGPLQTFAHRWAAVLKGTRTKRHCTTVFASGSRLSRIDTFDTKRAGNRTSPLRL
jgi:hypothetical protein